MTNYKVNIINQDGKKTTTTISGTLVDYYRYLSLTPEQKAVRSSDFDNIGDFLLNRKAISQSLVNDVAVEVYNRLGYADKYSIEFEIISRIHLDFVQTVDYLIENRP